MSTEAPVIVATVAPRSSSVRASVALGWREARRLLRSPVYVTVGIFLLATTGLGSVVGDRTMPDIAGVYQGILYLSALYLGLLTYLAAHLVTSSTRRSDADRQLDATPLDDRAKGGAACLGVLLGPGSVALVLVLVLGVLGALGTFDAEGQPFSSAELGQIFMTVIGGGLFGVLTATWLRFPGSLPVGLLVLMFGTIFLANPKLGPDNVTPWLAPYLTAKNWGDEPWALMGSQTWHAIYLAGLCALACCGVLLHQREGRLRWLSVGAGLFVLTALAGWVQL